MSIGSVTADEDLIARLEQRSVGWRLDDAGGGGLPRR